jgi:hypothetical protein
MMNPLESAAEYELHVYRLPIAHDSIRQSKLVVARLGATVAKVTGELRFEHDVRLVVWEHVQFGEAGRIVQYGYEVWQGEEQLYWYDSQPHPGEPSLQATHPHHKHVPPDIKHNRIPAPGLSFGKRNLDRLIEEIEALVGEGGVSANLPPHGS